MNILIELHYLPCIQYISKFLMYDSVIIDDLEEFGKQSYRNRCSIAGANGKFDLIIPVHGSRKSLPERDIRVDNHTPWYRQHWQSIKSAYGKTPFYEHYAHYFAEVYEYPPEFLFDFNLRILMIVLDILKIETTKLKFLSENPDLDFTDLRNKIHPKMRFQAADQHFRIKPYFQAFEERFGFLPNLSIIDLIFNEGAGKICDL